jgi:hypothetical protein
LVSFKEFNVLSLISLFIKLLIWDFYLFMYLLVAILLASLFCYLVHQLFSYMGAFCLRSKWVAFIFSYFALIWEIKDAV